MFFFRAALILCIFFSFPVFSQTQPKLKAVVFDWAGTTVDQYSEAPVLAFSKVFEEAKVPIETETIRKFMGKSKKDHIREILSDEKVASAWVTYYGSLPCEQDVETLYSQFIPVQLALLKDYSILIPGLLETVDFIRSQGWLIGTTTGYIHSMLDILISEAKSQGYTPDFNIASDSVPKGRPYPYMMQKVFSTFDCAPAHVVKVGDTVEDIEEGRNAGSWTILVLTGNSTNLSQQEINSLFENRSKPHFIIKNLTDLPLYLEEIDTLIKNGYFPFDY